VAVLGADPPPLRHPRVRRERLAGRARRRGDQAARRGGGRPRGALPRAQRHATFTVGGEELDAPTGTFVFVREPTTERVAFATEPDTVVLSLGGWAGKAYVPSDWEIQSFAS